MRLSLLSAAAAALLVGLTAPAVKAAPLVDVAAIPAYAPSDGPEAARPALRAAGRAAKGLRTARHGRGGGKASLRASPGESGTGIVRSVKTGATARVAPRYAPRFQAYVDDLEAHGAAVRFMGGYRGGPCAPPRHKHPCGMALDVCQLARGVVDGRCGLPPPATVSVIARRHGLTEGAIWCSTDYGHVEAGASAGGCASKGPRGLATMTGKIVPRPRAAGKKVRHPHVAGRETGRI